MLIQCNISAPPPYPVPDNDPFPAGEDEQKPLDFPTKAVNEMAPPMPDMPEMDPYVPPGDKDLPPLMSPMGPPGKDKNIKDFSFSISWLFKIKFKSNSCQSHLKENFWKPDTRDFRFSHDR